MTWREYHQFTKHTRDSVHRSQHILDWENMPDPFRHYEGTPVQDLPADPPPLEFPADDGSVFLSQLLFNSAAVSVSKLVPSAGYRYALRVNPSSGNLHPTEFHFLTRGLKNWPDGFFHYRASSHMAEQRAIGNLELGRSSITFLLTSIAWREAWKYRDRAYRYCMLDIGHAWQALSMAANAMGCESIAIGCFADDEVARICRLHEDEWPMLIVEVRVSETATRSDDAVWFGGSANQLSAEKVRYTLINEIHAATKIKSDCRSKTAASGISPTFIRDLGQVARKRRSALDFRGGTEAISIIQLSAILAEASQPLFADFAAAPFIQLYLYVHRVEGLEPGVYRYSRKCEQLEPIRLGDQRVVAAGLSLGQDLAGNACVAFSMIADMDRAVQIHGDRGYRYVHFEAGAIGQRLYLAAEALGLGATGIGAFFDDEVHRYLNIEPGRQVVYHFAIGYPVPDPRLSA